MPGDQKYTPILFSAFVELEGCNFTNKINANKYWTYYSIFQSSYELFTSNSFYILNRIIGHVVNQIEGVY